ncbi:MAG: glutamate synthase large subunit, partial [Woeseia sp.]|nr:glutamate synthase large subunit [Woeseia sp.]
MASSTATGLYEQSFDRDSCGFGLIANIDNQPSHWVLDTAIKALARLTHRGAVAADGKTGDGCGLLIGFPESFLRAVGADCSMQLAERFAAGCVFLSQDEDIATATRDAIEIAIEESGLLLAGWRVVPVDPSTCGEHALRTLPRIEQVFVNAPDGMQRATFNRSLFMARRRAEQRFFEIDPTAYVASLSSVTLSYKGMVMPEVLPQFYLDLQDERLATSVCLFHQRFSTNTLPAWRLAQPFRFLAHNGEINTISGNRNWALARAENFVSDKLEEVSELHPIISLTGSDSSSLDNMLEVMRAGGMDVLQAMRMLIPPAWHTVDTVDPDVRAFYEFWDCHLEPWDGPAGIVLTDGRYAACCLDRNGLRPARYVITRDRHITIASEIGVHDYENKDVVAKGRLGPGEMLAVDLRGGRLLHNDDINDILKARAPYKKWLKQGVRYLDSELVDRHMAAEPMVPETLKT